MIVFTVDIRVNYKATRGSWFEISCESFFKCNLIFFIWLVEILTAFCIDVLLTITKSAEVGMSNFLIYFYLKQFSYEGFELMMLGVPNPSFFCTIFTDVCMYHLNQGMCLFGP